MTTRLLTASDYPSLIQALDGAERLYVDTEFHPEHRYLPRLYVLQVAPETGPVWLIDCADLTPLGQLTDALCSAEWVVHGGSQDIALLSDALGRVPERIWDTQILAGLVTADYPRRFSDLVSQWTGDAVDKGATLTNWKRRPLSPEQLAYAQADVISLRPLARTLLAEVDRTERRGIAAAACDQARDTALRGPDPDDVWRRLQAARALTHEQASVLRELAAWREGEAKDRNQPPRQVLHDGLMLELARNPPSDVAALGSNRRVPKRIATTHGPDIVSRAAEGLRRAVSDPPRLVRKFSPEELTLTWLDAACRIVASQQAWSVDLVLPRSLQWDLVLADRAQIPARLGWRTDLLGDLVSRALHGSLSLQRTSSGWKTE